MGLDSNLRLDSTMNQWLGLGQDRALVFPSVNWEQEWCFLPGSSLGGNQTMFLQEGGSQHKVQISALRVSVFPVVGVGYSQLEQSQPRKK